MRNKRTIFLLVCLTFLLNSCDKQEPDGKGRITFWTNDIGAHGGWMNVTIEGNAKQILLQWPSIPDCDNTQGTARFELESGIHAYSVTDANGQVTFGNVIVYKDQCTGKQLD
ncbi:hypothetical protein DBR32_10485 [Taibaiella sp. KBW10]|uniref:hypothetical protein n=1 Tax=Taibaiella sp. KBW10 TaxID=2153357 RepID=UPI000F5A4132|nr:hypothetical protein [Taibaiella sp. KBW10]RQO31122.1 hypothetical protein DBR32_10485 [Taibaiella sp. KBW10]